MERTEEALRERVRETPLSERLKTCEKYIASMCAERRPPKMTIPLQHYDEDFYIYTTLADAQATIAALQARVQELEQWVQDQSTANLETMRHTDEMQSRALEAEQQLTQRTAELEAVKADTKNMLDVATSRLREQVADLQGLLKRTDENREQWRKLCQEAQSQLTQRTAELEAAKREVDVWKEKAELRGKEACAQRAELERVRGELAKMRERKDGAYLERNCVVAALATCFPSGVARTAIEGWDEEWHGCVYIDLPVGQVSWHYHDSHAHLFAHLPAYTKPWDGHTTEEKYERVAMLQHRQGMEG